MNTEQLNPVVITEEDYQLLKQYANNLPDSTEEMSLSNELKRAVIVSREEFPKHGIRINSRVSVLDLDTQRVLEFTLVMPEHADMKQNRVSILTPIGAALIGFRKAEEVRWRVPAGLKRFRILDVTNRL